MWHRAAGRAAYGLHPHPRTHAASLRGDPWDGRNLEWATPSPPPVFNFAALPVVAEEEPYWDIKNSAHANRTPGAPSRSTQPIEMPRNSPVGFVTAFFAVITGFSLIWHIWWLVVVGLFCAYVTFVVFAWRDVKRVHRFPADEVARIDRANRAGTSRIPAARLLR